MFNFWFNTPDPHKNEVVVFIDSLHYSSETIQDIVIKEIHKMTLEDLIRFYFNIRCKELDKL